MRRFAPAFMQDDDPAVSLLTGGVQAPGGSQSRERVAREVSPSPDVNAALRDRFMPTRNSFLGPQWDDARYQQQASDESRLASLLAQALNPQSRSFDSVGGGRKYQEGLAVNTTQNRRRGQQYATYVGDDGNLYHEYVVKGRRRSILVGPADRKLMS
jgi:hypothetical protein